MKLGDSIIKSMLVDNQELFVPDISEWEQIIELNPLIDGKRFINTDGRIPEAITRVLRANLDLVKKYNSIFSLAFYKTHPNVPFLILVLFKTRDKWQRVHIERLTCDFCGWAGYTANPTLSDLYMGIPNKSEALREAFEISIVPCPQCLQKLPRHPIWVEPAI